MTFADRFWQKMYERRGTLLLISQFSIFLLLLGIFAVIFSEPGSESRVIAYLDVALVSIMLVLATGTYAYAMRRHKESMRTTD